MILVTVEVNTVMYSAIKMKQTNLWAKVTEKLLDPLVYYINDPDACTSLTHILGQVTLWFLPLKR